MTNRSPNQISDRSGANASAPRTPAPSTEDHIARAMRVLMDREWPGPNPPDRNHRIEESIMAGSSIKSVSKRHLWAGGILLLIAGSAIGAVASNIITQRFTGYVELEDGSRVQVQGEMLIETNGDNKHVTINAAGIPEGAGITGGQWTTEDGSVIQVEPVNGGAEATYTSPATEPAKTGGN